MSFQRALHRSATAVKQLASLSFESLPHGGLVPSLVASCIKSISPAFVST